MELLYKNEYGATYKILNSPNKACGLQLVVNSIGLFMSKADLQQLLTIVRDSHQPCFCDDCNGERSKIWTSDSLVDICLKIDKGILYKMEDLIKGTLFMLDMDSTLEKFRLK